MQIVIRIKSYDLLSLQKALMQIGSKIMVYFDFQKDDGGYSFNGRKSIDYFFLPKKKKRWTVLRSPHIDKKSREQYELTKWKAVLKYKFKGNINNRKLYLFLHTLKQMQLLGVQIQVQCSFTDFLRKGGFEPPRT